MMDRCYKDFVNNKIEINQITEHPLNVAEVLKLDPDQSTFLYDAVSLTPQKRREEEAAKLAENAAEEVSKPDESEHLYYPVRTTEPAVIIIHAYKCSDCGCTMFPTAGPEFKFYGDDFVFPQCVAPKCKFVYINLEEE